MVKRQNVLFGLLAIVLVIGGGWSFSLETEKDRPLNAKIKEITHLINGDQWGQAMQETDVLRELYQKEKWKLQLLGDEMEYEQIDQELEKLPTAIHEQDGTQAKMILSTIRALLHNIYSM